MLEVKDRNYTLKIDVDRGVAIKERYSGDALGGRKLIERVVAPAKGVIFLRFTSQNKGTLYYKHPASRPAVVLSVENYTATVDRVKSWAEKVGWLYYARPTTVGDTEIDALVYVFPREEVEFIIRGERSILIKLRSDTIHTTADDENALAILDLYSRVE